MSCALPAVGRGDDVGLSERAPLAVVADDGALFHDRKGRPVGVPHALAPLADSHGHLTHFRAHDPAVALARAALAGVRLLVVPLDPVGDAHDAKAALCWLDRTVEQAAELLESAARRGYSPPELPGYEDVPPLVDNVRIIAGAHPYGAEAFLGVGLAPGADATFGEASHEALELLLGSPRCVGVGEVGLDVGPYSELPLDVQLEALVEQLRLAHSWGLPVELHIRDGEGDTLAHGEVARALRAEGVPAAGCDLHCFTAGPEVMAPFVELGCHVAFGGAVTFPRSADIRDAAAACPSDLLLCETDTPYMAPVPLRGQECEPAMVAFSAACLAAVREEVGAAAPSQTYKALWDNACALFGCR